MWEKIGQNGALILSLVISVYTVYSLVEARVARRRRIYAIVQGLSAEYGWFLSLASSLSGRAEQVISQHAPVLPGEAWPSPSKEADSLPDEVRPDVEWLISRTEQVTSYRIAVDIEKVGEFLREGQIKALIQLAEACRTYTNVLAARATDLKMYPRKKGVLVRFAGVAGGPNLEEVRTHLAKFRQSVALKGE